MDKPDLLPCPFCGGAPTLFSGGSILNPAPWAICYGRSEDGPRVHEVVSMPAKDWSTRARLNTPSASLPLGSGDAVMVPREVIEWALSDLDAGAAKDEDAEEWRSVRGLRAALSIPSEGSN